MDQEDRDKYLGEWRRRENDNVVTVADVREVKDDLEAYLIYASGIEAWLLVEVLEKVYEKVDTLNTENESR